MTLFNEMELARAKARINSSVSKPTTDIQNFEYGQKNPEFASYQYKILMAVLTPMT